VRYLQDNVIAYQGQAWGDGEILLNYRCTPGTPVDRHRSGHKTYILVSRREVKNRGDGDEFNVEWGIRQGFLKKMGYWETHVTHRTRHLEINVIFPKSRPPRRTTLVESNRQRGHAHHINAQAITGVERAVEVKVLRDQGHVFHAKDIFRPVAGVVRAPTGIVEHDILVGHAAGQRVLPH